MKVYNLETILKVQQSSPNLEVLFQIVKNLFKFSNISSSLDQKSFIDLLDRLKSNKSLEKDFLDWISIRLNEITCKNCLKNPSNKSKYPFKYCDSCITLFKTELQCLKCHRKYVNSEYFSNCGHFCIYCSCSLLRSGQNACPTCNDSIERTLLVLGRCDNNSCETRSFLSELPIYDHCIVVLHCGHSFCGKCLGPIIKRLKCPIDSSNISYKRKNYIVTTFSDKCQICKVRKAHNKLLNTDCYAKICQKCLKKHSSQCQVCSRFISN